jgi:hypothetical protein
MEHPLIGDLSNLTVEEISSKINELYKKMAIAQRSGNGHLTNQVRMAIETYQNQYQQRLREENNKKSSIDFDGIINIE